jgi:hypothetical protein
MAFTDTIVSPAVLPTEINEATAPWFAEGRRLEAEGRYDEAFAAFAEGNRIKAEHLDPAQFVARHGALVKLLKSVFTPAFLAEYATNNPDDRPIFIVGVPRSGSTLVEQILCSHPQVQGMGESQSLMRLASGAFPFDPKGHLDPARMAIEYLNSVRDEGWVGDTRFSDKALLNALAIGNIHMMFPRSTIINCSRDAIDTCFSCFRTDFTNGGWLKFGLDLTTVGHFYASHREMMNHWSFSLMGRVINVEYEALVRDPDGQIRWLLDVCRLPWDDACLRFFENPREVRTASADQVRRPIFHDSVGRWRHYREHLGPLIEALGPFAPRDVQ